MDSQTTEMEYCTPQQEECAMQIENDKVVAFRYVLKDDEGAEVERSGPDQPMVYLHGHRTILPALEEKLAGSDAGRELSITLAPEQAYGARRDSALQRIPIKHVMGKHKRYQPGMTVKINTDNGPRDVVIVKVGRFNLDVDNNHPLAGKTVTFEITVEKVRDATGDEIAHGHTHGIDGHDDHD
jgi:FKBP-type peptidyl-prolyl cis-trans isomerase SlyD